MAKIHHMTQKLAEKCKVLLALNADASSVVGTDETDTTNVATGTDAKDVLNAVVRNRKSKNEPKPNVGKPLKPPVKDDDRTTDDGEDKVSGTSIVRPKYKTAYRPHDDTNGDGVAEALIEHCRDGKGQLDLHKLGAIANQNGVDLARYKHLNNGQIRMNVGNRLRSLIRNGTDVVIGTLCFAGHKQEK